MSSGRVLVVESDAETRDRIGSWLEDDGYDVIACPGPTRPEYTCVGSRTQHCPLTEGADVIVLDLVLEGDVAMEGTPANALLMFYTWDSKKVVALRHAGEAPRDEDDVIFNRWPPDRDGILGAVRRLNGGSSP
jgi:hypothetical protein